MKEKERERGRREEREKEEGRGEVLGAARRSPSQGAAEGGASAESA